MLLDSGELCGLSLSKLIVSMGFFGFWKRESFLMAGLSVKEGFDGGVVFFFVVHASVCTR